VTPKENTTMPNTNPRPVIFAMTTGNRVEDVNLYTDLMAAAIHDEGATVRTGGHAYPVEVLTAPHGRPDDAVLDVPAAVARGIALENVYRAALDTDDTDNADATGPRLSRMVADLLHLAAVRGVDVTDLLPTAHRA
jgi:hypothetical protein